MFFRKRPYVFIVIFILIGFSLLTYQGIRSAQGGIMVSPFIYLLRDPIKGVSSILRSGKNLFKSYILIAGKEDDVRRLTEKVKELEQERNKFIEVLSENKRLREILELKSKTTHYVATATVFARDPTNWFQILWIDKGSEAGVRKGMIAVTPSGIVGRIHKVFKDTANIILITDINSSLSVRLQTLRHEGILEGRGGGKCHLKYIPEGEEVRIGEKVITSGLDGVYPQGLQVGYISNVIEKSDGLFQYIEVTPSQNLNKVEEVVILKSSK